ncbi:lantibiotic dehydratase [Streptomyces specialis]|uniref:lantibiotic dehydratase n=1 Tax=Streptomyces specialis TaxID=498367 RepID=UPI00073EC5AF|nr:lantibiotic dehydratase [Streptomyces specialis]
MVRHVFTHQPVAMARVPLRPAAPDPDEDSAGLLAEGVFLASRSMTHADDSAQAAVSSRLRATWRAYDIRSRSRPTPHGVFSGVAPAIFTDQSTALRLGTRHRTITTVSPAWLITVTDQLLDGEELLPHLTLTSNNLAVRRGDRLEAEHAAPNGGMAQRSSIRATEVSLWVLDTCREGMPARTVLAGLATRYPAAGETVITTAVRQMIRTGLLLTDSLPAHMRDDPLGHLLARLPSSVALRPVLERLRDLLTRADEFALGTPQRLALLRAARRTADEVVTVERPLAVDTLADATLAVPRAVGEEAAQAAGFLWRISQTTPPRTPYYEKFVRTYGHQRLVPLLEVIDPAIGIGPPDDADDIGAQRDIEPRRAALLARLLGEATARGQAEVVVDDALAEQLAHSAGAVPPRTAEIHVRLLRHGGHFRIAVGDMGSQDAGSAAGRFARWLPQLAPEVTGSEGAMVAEIVCRPRTGPPAALAVETGFAPHRIPLGVPERACDLLPEELLIGTAGRHLVVWSARHQRPVIPVLFSRLTRELLPPAAHALRVIGHAGIRPWHAWSWGPAGCLPFAPRVRYKNILVAPARWRLPEELTSAASDRHAWDRALAAWRTDSVPSPPDVMVVQESDRQLPIDLRLDEDRELLRRSVRRGARAITEPLGGPGVDGAVLEGPGGRHVVELVVNLTRRDEPPTAQRDPRSTPRRHSAVHRPGGNWISAAVPVPAGHQDGVLGQLYDVLAPAGRHIDRWFWLRFHTPALGDHLRIRATGDPEVLALRVVPLLTAWCSALADQRLAGRMVLESYEPETERYGGPKAMSAAEEVFAADSAFAARCLALTRSTDERLLVAAVSAVDIVRTVTDQNHKALRGHRLTPPDRRTRDALRPRLRSAVAQPASRIPAPLAAAWSARHEALAAYRIALADPGVSALCASDLVHMHCNRLLGPDPARERIARSLATDLLHAQAHVHEQ